MATRGTGPLYTTATVSDGAADVAERLLDGVVQIRGGTGSGSGVIWDADGLIVTNSHVVQRDEVQVVLRDGTQLRGRVVARDPRHDLAALEVDRTGLPALVAGDSHVVRVGQLVLAVGNPMGLRNVVTAGIITSLSHAAPGAGTHRHKLIQADVALAPGNSGGPLANTAGHVLGINAMIGSGGIALAVPVDLVESFLYARRKSQPYLGIEGLAIELRLGEQQRGGLLLTAVEDNSPAAQAGMLQGDVLLSFAGDDIASSEQFQSRLWRQQPGAPVRLRVLRGTQQAELTVVPEERERL